MTHYDSRGLATRMLVPAGADCLMRAIPAGTDLKRVLKLEMELVRKMEIARPWVCIVLVNPAQEYLSWGVVKYSDLVVRQSKTRPRVVTILKTDCRPVLEQSLPYVFDEQDCQLPPHFNLDDIERVMRERYTEAGRGVASLIDWNLLSYRLCTQAVAHARDEAITERFIHAETQLAQARLSWEHMALILMRHTEKGGYVLGQQSVRKLYADVCDVAEYLEQGTPHVDVQNGCLFAPAPLFMPYVLSVLAKVHRSNLAKQRLVVLDQRLIDPYRSWLLQSLPQLPPPPLPPKTHSHDRLTTAPLHAASVNIEECLPACMRELFDKGTKPAVAGHLKFAERSVFYRFALRTGMKPDDLAVRLRYKGQSAEYVKQTILPEIKSTDKFIRKMGDHLKDDSCGTLMTKTNEKRQSMCPFHREEGADFFSATRGCHADQRVRVKKERISFPERSTPIAVAVNIAKHIHIQLENDTPSFCQTLF